MNAAPPRDTAPAPDLPPWCGPIACPFRPRRRTGEFLTFEERYPPRGFGPRYVHLTRWQIDHGDLRDLEIRADWLAQTFPAVDPETDAPEDCFDRAAVAAWILHHCEQAERRRGWTADRPPAPAPPHITLTPLAPSRHQVALCSVSARQTAHGVRLSMIIATPSPRGPGFSGDEHATGLELSRAEAFRLASVLTGREITP